jgi:hypothetical protein
VPPAPAAEQDSAAAVAIVLTGHGFPCRERHRRRPRAGKTAWAALHTVRRHGGRVEGVIVLELDVPRRWLRRNRRGLWYTPRDVPPGRIKRVIDFGELAASPAEAPAA